MKLVLQFDEEDKHGVLQQYLMAEGMYLVLWHMTQWLRDQCKHNPQDYNDAGLEVLDKVNTELYDIMYTYNVDLDRGNGGQ